MHGSLDEITRFDRALSGSDLRAIYNASTAGLYEQMLWIPLVEH